MKHFIIALFLAFGGAALASGLEPSPRPTDDRVPLKIHQTVPALYPYSMIDRGIVSGSVRVAITVDNTGRLTDVLVVAYSHEPFAEAAESALRAWSYEPMRLGGEHVATQAEIVLTFSATGTVVRIDASTDLSSLLMPFRNVEAYGPCPLRQLDRIPRPVEFVDPAYSRELAQHGVRGTAVVEFYIDEWGAVRVPAVVASDFWELGTLALEAVRQWRFEPPTRNGRPVLIRVRQSIVFGGTLD